MVVPVGPIFPGRGKAPLEPQAFYVQTYVGSTPDLTKIFRPIWRSLPETQTPEWYRGGPENLRTWTWQYNPNLIGRDRLPAGEQVYDLVPAQRPPEQIQLHSWNWSYNLNLIGKDRLPAGEQVFELPPRAPAPLLQTWLLGTTALTLAPVAKIFRGPLYSQFIPPTLFQTWIAQRNIDLLAPALIIPPPGIFTQDDWPNPTQPSRLDQTWTWQYNKNLIGKDQLPTGEQIYDLVPSQRPADQVQLRAWQWSYNLNLVGKDRLPAGEQVSDLPPRDPRELRAWQWSYNLNLIAKDQLPTGEQVSDLPPRDPRELRVWTWSYNLNLIGQDRLPTGEQTTDLAPRAPQQPALSWTASYNLNLVAQDQLPFRQTDWPNPVPPPLVKDWVWSVNLNLATAFQKPFAQYDWPLTPAAAQPERTISASYNKNLIGQDRLPTGEQFSDLPPRDPREVRDWRWSYNLNLVGKDRLPFRQPDWPVPPPVTWYQSWAVFQLGELELEVPFSQLDWPNPTQPWRLDQTYTASYNKNLIGQDRLPNRQTDWPNPTQPYRIDQTVAVSYNLNLIGQDKLPIGAELSDLPPRDFARLFQTWIQNTNLALLTAPPNIFAQARQQDWPVPRGAEPDWRRSWEWSYNRNLIAQDQLPIRQQDWPNPVQPAQVKDWIQGVNISLTAAPKPFAQYDWPISLGAAQPIQIVVASFNLNLIGQDRLPTGARAYDLWPAGPQQPDRFIGASYNRNLIGQDRLPNRQSDWPLNFGPLQPDRFVAGSYNKNLIGQDRLPPGANFYGRLDLGPAPLLQQAIYEYNLAFIPTVTPPPSAAVYAKTFLAGPGFLQHIPGGNPPS